LQDNHGQARSGKPQAGLNRKGTFHMNIIDMHCDTIMRFYEGEHLSGMENSHINLEKLVRGGCLAQCFAIFVPTFQAAERHGITGSAEEYFDKAYAAYLREMELCSDTIRPAYSTGDIIRNHEQGYISSVLTVEDGVTIAGDLANVDDYYKKGVRMVALTWNYENSLGFPQSPEPGRHMLGLKPFGIEAVRRMNELGIAVDVSHLSEGGFWDVAKHTSRPFIASHSCCRALRDHSRNLTDEQLKALADKGGVCGVNFATNFLREAEDWKTDRYVSCELVIRHLQHMLDVGGRDLPALGSDYDGMGAFMEWEDYGGYQMLAEHIADAFGDEMAEKICWKNAFAAFREIIG